MLEQEFKEGRNLGVVVGNTWMHQVTDNGDPEHLLPILKKAQTDSMNEGKEDRNQVAVELDYILEELFPECTADLMEVYIHDWIYMLDPDGSIRYGKCTDKKHVHIKFENF